MSAECVGSGEDVWRILSICPHMSLRRHVKVRHSSVFENGLPSGIRARG